VGGRPSSQTSLVVSPSPPIASSSPASTAPGSTPAAALPLEWRIEGVVCTSIGLRPEQRSDRWRAWATGPKGQKAEAEGDGPIAALHALARELRPLRGSASG